MGPRKRLTNKDQHQFQPRVFLDVKDNGVNLTIRYLCAPQDRRSTVYAIWEEILTEFAKHKDIALAYPTTRIYREPEEGVTAKPRQQTGKKLPRAHG